MIENAIAPESRRVRAVDVDMSALSSVANGVADLYDDKLDVIIIRNAFPIAPTVASGERLDRDEEDLGWAHPNERMPVEDIQVIGTAATPTYGTPQGPSLETYLQGAERVRSSANAIFDFSPGKEFERVLGCIAGGRPVEVPQSGDGRGYTPFTVRRLVEGKQIGLHHDYHYPLPVYGELAPQLDTRTLVSFVVTIRKPDAGGELYVYPVTSDTPNPPKQPNGWSWDLQALEQRFPFQKFVTNPGDMFVFASGRCLHRVAPIVGSRARITMGGFLALDRAHERILYWS